MKTLRANSALIAALLVFASPVAVLQSGCAAPSHRVVEGQTLKAVGHITETAVLLSAKLYGDGKITADEARRVMAFYDEKFQPAYRVAVSAVKANLDSIASPDLASLANDLVQLVASYQKQ